MTTIATGESERLRLTVAQALVRFLAAQYSERDGVRQRVIPGMFGIFGHGNVCGVGQALEEDDGRMPYYQGKNEQAMVHAAIGFAKARDRLATLACTTSIGPGSTNLVTGAATATVNRVPVLLLPSDTFATRLQGPPMQSLDDSSVGDLTVNDCLRPVSRYFDRVSRPEQLLTVLPNAIRTLLDPEHTGAVTVSLHQDVQAEVYDFPLTFFADRTWTVSRRPPAPDEIRAAAEAFAAASRPMIIAGGGVLYSGATSALARLAETLTAPVAETSAGKGALPAHELSVGAVGHSGTRAANALARKADVILCVGTRLIDLTTGSNTLFQDPDVQFIGLNLSLADAHKLRGLQVIADARLGLEALARALPNRRRPQRAEEISALKTAWAADLDADLEPRSGERMSQGQVLKALNDQVGDGDAVVVASGTPHVDIHKLWDCSRGRVFMEVGFSCMGHEIPAALGVRLANGFDGEIYAVIGDGTYLMGSSEIATAVQEHLKITVVVFENHGYQSIHALQRGRIGRSFGLEFRERANGAQSRLDGPYLQVDLAANARSYGATVFTVDTLSATREAFEAARNVEGPCVIVASVAPMRLMLGSDCWWDVGVPGVARRAETQSAVKASDRGRALQRYLG